MWSHSLIVLSSTPTWKMLLVIAALGTMSSTLYLGMVLIAAIRYRRRTRAEVLQAATLPPVTVLKPVHGAEPLLFENLQTFFTQDYPDFEVVIGARDENNPALQVAQAVREKHPNVKSRVVVSGFPSWSNAKVFSLDKMISCTATEYFVISDSDIAVPPDFLRRVIPLLTQGNTGLVTCLYRGVPSGGFASRLEALGMSVELPSGVLVADMIEGMRFALGAAMAVRRDALIKIGGIGSTADYYSDDFVLGNEVWKAGYQVALASPGVEHVLMSRTWRESLGDQLRWMKSTRYSRPFGHIGSGLTYAVPFGLIGLIGGINGGTPSIGIAFLLAAILNRIVQCTAVGWGVIRDPQALKFCWVYPLRDLIGFLTWAASFTGRNFLWRGETYRFDRGGRITPQRRHSVTAVRKRLQRE